MQSKANVGYKLEELQLGGFKVEDPELEHQTKSMLHFYSCAVQGGKEMEVRSTNPFQRPHLAAAAGKWLFRALTRGLIAGPQYFDKDVRLMTWFIESC